ncbi:MAG: RdgB/HAM1 family non-canonical purine NTP pyrophosphatase [Hyphomicrobium sp.]
MRKLTPGSKLVVASHNKGKVWEINQLLTPYGLAAVSAGDLKLAEPEETETTFEGNALIKARAAAEGSGLPALADDSGLEIDAIDGAPGVYSANWAGPGKDFSIAMQRVHDELDAAGAWKKKKKPPRANFISVLCLAWPDGRHKFFEGKVKGHLVWPPRGGNGFGYDPIFVAKGETLTFGEMEPAQKYAISHRTRAFEKFEEKCLRRAADEAPSPPPNAVRDAAGLAAAAANISTREELVTLIANLRMELVRDGEGSEPSEFLRLLAALQSELTGSNAAHLPPWRAMARALLAARP